jgi:soluble lytic murein transglycosylase-like protein
MLLLAPAWTSAQQIYVYRDTSGETVITSRPLEGRTAAEVHGERTPARAARPQPPGSAGAEARPAPDPHTFDALIREAAETYSLPFEFIKAVIRVESAFDPHAVSHAGAMGLMQLMPGTARALQCDDPFDPRQNIMAGTRYLRMLADTYDGNINLVLAAYNAGPGNVARAGGNRIPFQDTVRYVERVAQYWREYMRAGSTP